MAGKELGIATDVVEWLRPTLRRGRRPELISDPTDRIIKANARIAARALIDRRPGGFAIDPFYRPVADPSARFEQAAAGRPYVTRVLEPGESFASVSDAVAG